MRLRLAPLPFFIGLAAGLMALSWLGATVESSRLAQSFVRFHQLLAVETDYFVTARQVRSLVETRAEGEPRILVIVGGSSILHGVGQHESLIWTKFLQQHLGSRFRVINLAQRGGRQGDFGNIAAELLIKQSRPVIFVVDVSVTFAPLPFETSFYRHIIFDAWHRGYLLPWPPRDQLLSEAAWRGPKVLRASALGALLNAYLNFNDLWNYVSYEYANPNWNWLLATRSFQPRSAFADPDLMPDQYIQLQRRPDPQAVLRLIRAQLLGQNDSRREAAMRLTDQMIPPRLRAVTLAVPRGFNPHYVSQLELDERVAYSGQGDDHQRRLREIGFRRVMPASEFTEADYVDLGHLSVTGGQKLAAELAPVIREIAIELGYLP
jgi:hypothetical protein